MAEIIEIYALRCPDTNKVMYVGKSVNSAKRFKQHLGEKRRKSPLYNWISSLRENDKFPVLEVLEICNADTWQEREKSLISLHKVNGDLLNIAIGGNEPFCSKQIRQENGRKVAKLVHSDPFRKRIWTIKKNMKSALARGELKERHIEAMRYAARACPELFGEWANVAA